MAVIYTSPTTSKYRSDGQDSRAYIYYLTVDLLSQNVAANTSTVAVNLCMECAVNSGTEMWETVASKAPTTKITVEGTTYDSTVNIGSNYSANFIQDGKFRCYYRSTTPLVLCTKTLTIPHNSDGTKSITLSYQWVKGSGVTTAYYPVGFTSSSYTATLTTIPRSSQITCSSAVLVDNSTSNFSYTVTSFANFYHTLSYTLDGSTTTVWGTAHQLNNTSTTLTISYATLLTQVKTGTSKNLTFTLKTYSDSGLNTLIGTTTKAVVISIDTTVYKPTLSLTAIAANTTPISSYLVAGYSTAKVSYTATKPTGATSATIYFATNKGTLATTNTTTLSGSINTNTLPASTSNYTFTITAYAVDSRGVSSGNVTLTSGTVYGYKLPQITVSNCYRVATNGATTEDAAGEYVYINYSVSIPTTVNGQNTVQSKNCTFQQDSSTYPNPPAWAYQLAPENSGVFVFTATDRVATATVQVTVPPAQYPLDLYDDGTAQHLGVGLAGALAEADKAKTAKDFYAPNVFVGSTTDAAIRQVRISTLAGEIKISGDASAAGNRGIWVPAHGTGAATDVIKIDKDNNVTFYGSLANAGNATKLDTYPSMRPTSANQVLNDGTLTHFLSSSSMTTGKPASDGHIINCQWDNSNVNGVQLYMNHSNAHDQLGLRTSNTSWRAWEYADMRRTVWTGTAQGGTSISANVADYSYIKVYVSMFKVDLVVTVDLTHYPNKTVAAGSSNTTYRGSAAAPVYATGANTQRVETFYAVIEVPSAKTSVSILQLSYYYGTTNTTRNSNADYFAYKIEGYL